jgi:glycosyltransferase involved in cell wall biosynthesis
MVSLAVIILTYNEELHIGRAIDSVTSVAQEVFVIDSGSQDRTVAIANAKGAKVFFHPFINYAKQFQWALDTIPITAEWVMRLDADELIERDLANELTSKLSSLGAQITGINLRRKHIFMGRWIRYGGRYPLVLLRIWRNGKAVIEGRWMDEHMVLMEGRAVTFGGGFMDYNLNNLTFFIRKHNAYATREAIDVLIDKYEWRNGNLGMSSSSGSTQAALKRTIKEKIYNRMPFWLSSSAYFLYRYVILLGFMDGREGIVYHFLQAYWYRFLVGVKVFEYERVMAQAPDSDKALRELARLTGYDVSEFP